MSWTLQSAATLCRIVESIAPAHGCHVALTGGALCKDGERKDCDILFYRIRQCEDIDIPGLKAALSDAGFVMGEEHGWVHKATFLGKSIDMFFPETYSEVCENYGTEA